MHQSWDDLAETVQFTAPLNLAALQEHVASDAQILDLGCGYGRIASQLLSAGFTKVRGYDASEKMIERARAQDPQLYLSVADAAKLPEPDLSIDAVVVSALFTSIPAPRRQRAVVTEIQRVLKPDGSVHGVEFLREPSAASGAFKSKGGIAMWHFQPEELRRLFAAFTGWTAWHESVPSLSGSPSTVLQFVAYVA